MYCGNTVTYESRPYWNTTTDTVNYADSMSVPSLLGRDGAKVCIYKPHPVINIKIVNDDGNELTDYIGAAIPYVKLLLKFKPII